MPKLVDISGNSYHTCAVDDVGHVYCWGWNGYGALGINTRDGNYTTPVAVDTSMLFSDVDAGVHFNCGLTIDGDIACWGRNNYGQLGVGDTADRLKPQLNAPNSDGTKYTQISAGGLNACALDTNNSLWCWGRNGRGQLGAGVVGEYRSTPVKVELNGLLQGKKISKVSLQRGASHGAGDLNVCVITQGEGKVYCWGRNDSGDLGNGNTTSTSSPVMPLLPDNNE